jgi:hypothetical protein
MLNQSELETLLAMLTAMVECADLTDLALLQLLPPEQKLQLWAMVPIALRQSIHQLKSKPA